MLNQADHAAHLADHSTEHLGSFVGHVVPGSLFLLWGVIWLVWLNRATRPFRFPLERPVVIAGALLGALGEVWFASWRLVDSSVINYQHATMYAGFAIAAGSDLLAERGFVSRRLPTAILGGAFAVAGGLFMAHGSHVPASGAIHTLLAVLLVAAAATCLGESFRPSRGFAIARCWLTIAVGTWFWQSAWMLYVADYDLMSHGTVMRVHLFFAWHFIATGCMVLGASIALGGRGARLEPAEG